MSKLPRLVNTLAVVALLAVFLWPIWQIVLYAPQYPDGVKMYIYVDKLGGDSPGTLQNVNILNHYVGMKKIEPDSIPELKLMTPILLFFVVFGLITAIFDKKWMYYVWTLLLLVTFLVGLYDFYLWEYNYGHTLDPNAPMKFDGASFQPPVFGKKVILNFVVYSIPHIAGYCLAISAGLGILASFLKYKFSKA